MRQCSDRPVRQMRRTMKPEPVLAGGQEIVGVVMIQTPVFQVSRDVENALMQAILE